MFPDVSMYFYEIPCSMELWFKRDDAISIFSTLCTLELFPVCSFVGDCELEKTLFLVWGVYWALYMSIKPSSSIFPLRVCFVIFQID